MGPIALPVPGASWGQDDSGGLLGHLLGERIREAVHGPALTAAARQAAGTATLEGPVPVRSGHQTLRVPVSRFRAIRIVPLDGPARRSDADA